ncbi:MAG: hypothetical protein QXY62_04625 [Candidatus Altiarchaeota archaeon]
MENKKILAGIFTLLFLISCCIDSKKENLQEVKTTEITELTMVTSTQETTSTIATTTKLLTTKILTTTTYAKIPFANLVKISFSTDKEIYHSNEIMKIKVLINAEEEMNNVSVKIYGIMSGYYRLQIEDKKNLKKGLNEINFEYRTPSCTGCAGIRPGSYEVNVELLYDNETIAKETKNVNIKQ